MYNIPQGQIAFTDIEDFCKEEPEEDLILDYKAAWPNDLSRILCGMANVQGGMVLVGVDTQPGSRKPAWPPPGVDDTDDSLRQRAIQIAYDGIYPPVLPQVDIVRLPFDTTRAIVVIRVEASRLLHATDQRRRVYVRVFDHSRGVNNDLANLSQLEWLFQQRQKCVDLRQAIISRAKERAALYIASEVPVITACVTPVFPQQQSTKTPSEIRGIVNNIGVIGPPRGSTHITIPLQQRWRTTSEGAFVPPYNQVRLPQYLEVGTYGLVYLDQAIYTNSGSEQSTQGFRLIGAIPILSIYDIFLDFVAKFYESAAWHGPVQLIANLRMVAGFVLDHRPLYNPNPLQEPSLNRCSQDNIVNLYNGDFQASHLATATDEILKEITCNLMWGFGYSESREELEDYLTRTLR